MYLYLKHDILWARLQQLRGIYNSVLVMLSLVDLKFKQNWKCWKPSRAIQQPAKSIWHTKALRQLRRLWTSTSSKKVQRLGFKPAQIVVCDSRQMFWCIISYFMCFSSHGWEIKNAKQYIHAIAINLYNLHINNSCWSYIQHRA